MSLVRKFELQESDYYDRFVRTLEKMYEKWLNTKNNEMKSLYTIYSISKIEIWQFYSR